MAKNVVPERRTLVGVIPAAGKASRLGRIPCSKEILPVGLVADPTTPSGLRLQVAIECALDAFGMAGTKEVVIILSPEKNDIEGFLETGDRWGLNLRYEFVTGTNGAAHTIDSIRSLLGDADVALAYPDIQFAPKNAIDKIADLHKETPVDVTLALVPSQDGHKVDLVQLGQDNRVIAIRNKPGAGCTGWTWIAAVWSQRFTLFMHDTLERLLHCNDNSPEGTKMPTSEVYVGYVINEAIRSGLSVRGVAFDEGRALDIGTPDTLSVAWSQQDPKSTD